MVICLSPRRVEAYYDPETSEKSHALVFGDKGD